MDVRDEAPERWWVADADKHQPPLGRMCGDCTITPIDRDHAVPMDESGPLCQACATDLISNHPMTATYLEWLTKGDLRWWSPWVCQCEGCSP